MSARRERPGTDAAEPPGGAAAAETDRYRRLFELAPIAYIATDRAGAIVELNSAATELLGADPRRAVGKPLPLFAALSSRRPLRTLLLDAIRAGSPQEASLRLVRRDGVVFDALVRAASASGEIHWVIRDVSEARRAEEHVWQLNRVLEEEAMRRARELAAVLDELPLGVAIVDPLTGAARRLNPRAQEILGLDPGEKLESLDWRAVAGAAVPPSELHVSRALGGERVQGERTELRSPDGSTRVLEVSATPLHGYDGEVASVVATFDDVTERERRERADRDFVSNAAHQLRSPLAAIASSVAVLNSSGSVDVRTRTRFLQHLERETARMIRLANGLLSLARAERGEQAAPLTIVALAPVFATLADSARREGAEVVVDAADDLAAVSNEELLVEALSNLVTNAVRHAHADDPIELRGRFDGTTVAIEIADGGVGIPADELARAFERFHRPPHATVGGFGLGLAIARAAASAAGGALTIASTPGEGTTARIELRGAHLL